MQNKIKVNDMIKTIFIIACGIAFFYLCYSDEKEKKEKERKEKEKKKNNSENK